LLSSFLPAASAADPLVVAAASDLATLEADLSALYQKTYGHTLRFVPGSSGLLASQIRSGAPYDVYLSASSQYTDELAAAGHLVAGSVRVYAHGRLALFSKTAGFKSIESLIDPKVRYVAIANPAHAPYGIAAREFLERRKLWDRVKSKLVYGENIRQTLQLAESGNADAALVAWSLVIGKGGLLLPDSDHSPIRQAGGVVAASSRKTEARRLLDLLVSRAGSELLARFGFSPP
jgi:molybdate transport system substrate-binding protein